MSIYNFIAEVYYKLVVFRNYVFYKLFVRSIKDYKQIPIIINNRNRYSFLLQLIKKLEEDGYCNIHILDNDSTYPPLLEYYKITSHKVYFLEKNYGFKALELSGLIKKFNKDFFVYTDPDVVPIKECPSDYLEFFYKTLQKYPHVQKVGFSLKIDDLPNHFDKKNDVIEWESTLYEKEIDDGLFLAPIDTTFALHRPLARISTQGRYKNIRTKFPYEALHLPWYNDSKNLCEEEIYYIDNAKIGTHWTTGAGIEANIPFYKRIFMKK